MIEISTSMHVRGFQKVHIKMELKDELILVKRNLKSMHFFFIISVLHELFEEPLHINEYMNEWDCKTAMTCS